MAEPEGDAPPPRAHGDGIEAPPADGGSIAAVAADFDASAAIVVGIDRYDLAATAAHPGLPARVQPVPSRLSNAVKDARAVQHVLSQQHRYAVESLMDEHATKDGILQAIRNTRASFAAFAGNRTRLCLYFAGHGEALRDDQGPRGFLAPYGASTTDSATLLSMDDLVAALDDDALPRPHHCMVVLDCCFSGLSRWAVRGDIRPRARRLTASQYRRYTDRAAWQLLCSSAADQLALDTLANLPVGDRQGGENAHSPFAAAFLAGLQGTADQSGDGVVTATELYVHVRDAVELQAAAQGFRQTPGLWPGRRHEQGEYLFGVPQGAIDLRPEPELSTDDSPYRGMEAFREQDEPLFFGREAVVAALLDRVRASPLTIVLGATGAGKTSLVSAGLAPALRREGAWIVAAVGAKAGGTLAALAAALSAAPDQPFGAVSLDDLKARGALTERLRRAVSAQPVRGLVVVIDPFDALDPGAADDRALVQRLEEGMSDAPAHLRVVLVVRADREEDAAPAPAGAPLQGLWGTLSAVEWQAARFEVPPMTRDALRAAAERPALERAFYFDPQTLVDDLVDDVRRGGPAAAPALLSALLARLYGLLAQQWHRDEPGVGRAITAEMYAEAGRVEPSLAGQARDALLQLRAGGEPAAKQALWLLGRLVRKNERGQWDVRSVALRAIEPARADAWAEARRRLEAGRLVVAEAIAGMGPCVSLSHPALAAISAGLMDDDELRWHETHATLADAAGRWGGGRWSGLWVLRGSLVDARRLDGACPGRLSRVEARFLRASLAWSAVILTLAGLVVAGLGLFAAWSIRSEQLASARGLAAKANLQEDPVSALRLAIQAAEIAHAEETDDTIRRALIRDHARGVLPVADEPPRMASFVAGGALLMATTAHSVQLWRMPCGEPWGRVTVAGEAPILRAVFDAARAEVVVLREGEHAGMSFAERWSVAGPVLLESTPAVDVMLHPDGRVLAWVEEDDGASRLEDLSGPERAQAIPGQAWAVAPDGTAALYREGDRVHVLDFAHPPARAVDLSMPLTHEPPPGTRKPGDARTCFLRDAPVFSHAAVPSQDGRSLSLFPDRRQLPTDESTVAPGGAGALVNACGLALWSGDGGKAPDVGNLAGALFRGGGKEILLLEASHDQEGESTDADYAARLHGAGLGDTGLPGHTGMVVGAAFGSGDRVATASEDGLARVWDLAGRLDRVLIGHEKAVGSVSFGPDDRLLLTASADGTLRLWEVTPPAPEPLVEVRAPPADATPGRPSFVPPESTVAAVGADGDVAVVVDVSGPACGTSLFGETLRLTTLRVYRRGVAGVIKLTTCAPPSMGMAWLSRSGRFLALSSGGDPLERDVVALRTSVGQGIRVWQLDGRAAAPALVCEELKQSLAGAISADERRMAIGCEGEVILAPGAGGEPYRLAGHLSRIHAMAFSPDGRLLATGDRRGDLRLWDALAGEPLHWMRDHRSSLRSLAFSPDGALLATSDEEESDEIRIWDTRTGQLLTRLSGAPHASRLQFSPDGRTLVAAAMDDGQRVRFHVDVAASGDALLALARERLSEHETRRFPGCAAPPGPPDVRRDR